MGYYNNVARWFSLDSRIMSVDISCGGVNRTVHMPAEWSEDFRYKSIKALYEAPVKETVEEKDEGGNEDDYLQYLNLNAEDDFMPPILPDQEIAAQPQPQPDVVAVQPQPQPDVVVVQPEPDVVVVQPEPDVVQPEPDLELPGAAELEKWIKVALEAGKNIMAPKMKVENERGTGNNRKRKRVLFKNLRMSFEVTDDIREFTIHLDNHIIGGGFNHKRPRLAFEERIRGWKFGIKRRKKFNPNNFNRFDWRFTHERVDSPFRSTTEVIRFILHNKYQMRTPAAA